MCTKIAELLLVFDILKDTNKNLNFKFKFYFPKRYQIAVRDMTNIPDSFPPHPGHRVRLSCKYLPLLVPNVSSKRPSYVTCEHSGVMESISDNDTTILVLN